MGHLSVQERLPQATRDVYRLADKEKNRDPLLSVRAYLSGHGAIGSPNWRARGEIRRLSKRDRKRNSISGFYEGDRPQFYPQIQTRHELAIYADLEELGIGDKELLEAFFGLNPDIKPDSLFFRLALVNSFKDENSRSNAIKLFYDLILNSAELKGKRQNLFLFALCFENPSFLAKFLLVKKYFYLKKQRDDFYPPRFDSLDGFSQKTFIDEKGYSDFCTQLEEIVEIVGGTDQSSSITKISDSLWSLDPAAVVGLLAEVHGDPKDHDDHVGKKDKFKSSKIQAFRSLVLKNLLECHWLPLVCAVEPDLFSKDQRISMLRFSFQGIRNALEGIVRLLISRDIKVADGSDDFYLIDGKLFFSGDAGSMWKILEENLALIEAMAFAGMKVEEWPDDAIKHIEKILFLIYSLINTTPATYREALKGRSSPFVGKLFLASRQKLSADIVSKIGALFTFSVEEEALNGQFE